MGNCAGHISLHGYYGGNFIMMRSLFSAVSGLKAHQTKMDVIGNNIANVNTVAYKSQSVTFGRFCKYVIVVLRILFGKKFLKSNR